MDQQIIGSAKKDLDENGYKLLSNIIITDEKQLDEILPLLRKTLKAKTIMLRIVPNHDIAPLPLFFKEYYLSKNNHDKTWLIAVALDKIIKALEQYFKQDEKAYEHIKVLEKHIRRLLGAVPLDEFEAQQSIRNNKDVIIIDNYVIKGERRGSYFCLRFIYNDRLICQCNDWPGFQKCINDLKLPSEISVHHKPKLWNCISNKIYEILYKERQIRINLKTLIEECKSYINKNNQETYKRQEENPIPKENNSILVNKLYRLINNVLNEKSVKTLEINGYKIIAKPSTISYLINTHEQNIILDVYKKRNGVIEITIDNKVYQIYKDELKHIVREILGKIIFQRTH